MAGIEFGPPYRRRFAETADELERLRAIVATLPKCWRMNDAGDDVVQDYPVVPGMDLYFWNVDAVAVSCNVAVFNDQELYDNYANSPEAAEVLAARKEPE